RRPRHALRAPHGPPPPAGQRAARRQPGAWPRPGRSAGPGACRRRRPVPRPTHPRRGAVTAIGIAHAVRTGERSARDVVEEHLAAIALREPELHAFNLLLADEARAAADEIDRRGAARDDPGPLAGVPVPLKDTLCPR